ncbi:MAG: sulfurtransferase TusA family protein [Alphaproteobacteria bacterium]
MISADYYLDISDEVCPMTFVKTRLSIEKMSAGEVLEVRLRGEEPLQSVPDSLRELGHWIVSLTREEGTADTWRLIIEKTDGKGC